MAVALLKGCATSSLLHCDSSTSHRAKSFDGGDGTAAALHRSRGCTMSIGDGGRDHRRGERPACRCLHATRRSMWTFIETRNSMFGNSKAIRTALSCESGESVRPPRVICAAKKKPASESSSKPTVSIKNAAVVAQPAVDGVLQVRVEIPAEDTQRVFDSVIIELGKSAPPVPGFRRSKGGKTASVPKNVLLAMLGEQRVTAFVVERIVTSTLGDYVDREGLKVKKDGAKTDQSSEELMQVFTPGQQFGFDAKLELLPQEESSDGEPASAEAIVVEEAIVAEETTSEQALEPEASVLQGVDTS